MHSHKEVDVISVMVTGQIVHEGSLEHGQRLRAYNVQVQRAGREGFSHNEINPDDTENRMIQMWVLPETTAEPAGYKLYMPEWGLVTRVYGGSTDQNQTFASNTIIEVALLISGQRVEFTGPLMAYIVNGKGICNGEINVTEGDLISGNHLDITANMKLHIIVVRKNK
jgi:redox-sensitive bicupin YhaK (pirin superfamily)